MRLRYVCGLDLYESKNGAVKKNKEVKFVGICQMITPQIRAEYQNILQTIFCLEIMINFVLFFKTLEI